MSVSTTGGPVTFEKVIGPLVFAQVRALFTTRPYAV
jgi:hypothetical protein